MRHGLRVLMLPFLYFKDERQSSGIVHQSGLARALAAAGHSVVVAMPSGKEWRYDHERWFGGHANLTVRAVDYPQDLNFTGGLISPELARLLTPELTDVPYNAVFMGTPEAALAIKRFLYKKGHTRLNTPVVTYFDSVFGYDEDGRSRAGRGGSNPDFVRELMQLQVLSTLDCPAVLHIPNEVAALERNARELLAPSRARWAMANIHRVPRPYAPPLPPRRRTRQGGEFRVFVARSFGASDEEAGWQTLPLIRAVQYLRVKGLPIRTVLATQSPLDDWARGVIAEAGDSLELMHRQPREAVMAALHDCELSAYLTDFNGLFMSSIEAVCSGSPHLFKRTRYSLGEVNSPFWVESYEVEAVMAALTGMIGRFDDCAETAYANALIECELREPAAIGAEIGGIIETAWKNENPALARIESPVDRFPSMGATLEQVAAGGRLDGKSLEEARAAVAAARQSGTLGRYSVPWLAWALETMGYAVRLEGGLAAPAWRVAWQGTSNRGEIL